MTYELEFLPSALKEWRKLGDTVREQFKKKLKERLETPRVAADALHGMPDCYKIKTEGCRLPPGLSRRGRARDRGGGRRRQARAQPGL